MSDTAQKLGKKIRQLRNKYKISQEELAFNSSLSTTYLGQIERAEKSPTLETLEKISKALDIEIYELLIFDDNSQEKPAEINKITAQLSTFSKEEQKELLKIIKIFNNFKSLEKQ